MLLTNALRAVLPTLLTTSPLRAALPVRMLASSAFAGPRQQQIEQRLSAVFAPEHLEVLNESHGRKEDESHFKVVIVSEAFANKRLVARHRAVNDALLDKSGSLPFHSLSVGAAKTPTEWQGNTAVPASPKCLGGDGSGLKR